MVGFPSPPSLEGLHLEETTLLASGVAPPSDDQLRADFINLLAVHRITQCTVCTLTGLSSSSLSLWKSGKPVPQPSTVRSWVWWFLRAVREKQALEVAVRMSLPPGAVPSGSGGAGGGSSKSPRRVGRPQKRDLALPAPTGESYGLEGGLAAAAAAPPVRITAEQAKAMTPEEKQQYLASVIGRWAAGIIKQRRAEAESDISSVASGGGGDGGGSGGAGRGVSSSLPAASSKAGGSSSGAGSLGVCRVRRWAWAASSSGSGSKEDGEAEEGASASSSAPAAAASTSSVLIRRWSRISAILDVRPGVLAPSLVAGLGLAPGTPVPGALSGAHVLVQLAKKATATSTSVRLPPGATLATTQVAAVAAGLDPAIASSCTDWTPLAEVTPPRLGHVVSLQHDWVDAEDVDASELLLQYFESRGQDPEAVLPSALVKRVRKSVAARRVQVERRNSIAAGGAGGSGGGRPPTPEQPKASGPKKGSGGAGAGAAAAAAVPAPPPLVHSVHSAPVVIGAGRGKGLTLPGPAPPPAAAAAPQPAAAPVPQLAAVAATLPPMPPATTAARFTVAGVPIAGGTHLLTQPELLPPLPLSSGAAPPPDTAWLALGRRPYAGDAAAAAAPPLNTVPSNVGYWPGITLGPDLDTLLSQAAAFGLPQSGSAGQSMGGGGLTWDAPASSSSSSLPRSSSPDLPSFYPTYATASAPLHLLAAVQQVQQPPLPLTRPPSHVVLVGGPPPLAGTKRPREEDEGAETVVGSST